MAVARFSRHNLKSSHCTHSEQCTTPRYCTNAHEYLMPRIARAVLILLLAASSTAHRLRQSAVHSDDASLSSRLHNAIDTANLMLNTILCRDRGCSDECQTYLTPVNACFNGLSLFPDDPSWSEYDIFDTFVCLERDGDREGWTDNCVDLVNWETMSRPGEEKKDAVPKVAENFDDVSSFKRTFFRSKDSSCRDPTDEFDALPLNECIGPFGNPKPYGRFEIAARK